MKTLGIGRKDEGKMKNEKGSVIRKINPDSGPSLKCETVKKRLNPKIALEAGYPKNFNKNSGTQEVSTGMRSRERAPRAYYPPHSPTALMVRIAPVSSSPA
jgi:hypothetical protein